MQHPHNREWEIALWQQCYETFSGIRRRNVDKEYLSRFSFERETSRINQIKMHVDDCKTQHFLDIGCGWGGTVYVASQEGWKTWGVEPHQESWEVANILNGLNIIKGVGERLPFEDETFDIVNCASVLEHCKNPEGIVKEIKRVLRKDGTAFISCPNYNYPREPHYKIWTLPRAPKWLIKMQVRCTGQDETIADTLSGINWQRLKRALKDHRLAWKDANEYGEKEKSGYTLKPTIDIVVRREV